MLYKYNIFAYLFCEQILNVQLKLMRSKSRYFVISLMHTFCFLFVLCICCQVLSAPMEWHGNHPKRYSGTQPSMTPEKKAPTDLDKISYKKYF